MSKVIFTLLPYHALANPYIYQRSGVLLAQSFYNFDWEKECLKKSLFPGIKIIAYVILPSCTTIANVNNMKENINQMRIIYIKKANHIVCFMHFLHQRSKREYGLKYSRSKSNKLNILSTKAKSFLCRLACLVILFLNRLYTEDRLFHQDFSESENRHSKA